MNTFFITGPPRSRTAWIANLLTYGQSFCFHEAPLFCELNLGKIPALFESVNKPYVGNSDSSIPFYMDFYEKTFPNARHVMVVRDLDEVKKETDTIFGRDTSKSLVVCQAVLEEYQKRFEPLIVPFALLDNLTMVKMISYHCIPTEPFDETRYLMLKDFDIKLTENGLDKRRTICH